jgi:hypothetical protein
MAIALVTAGYAVCGVYPTMSPTRGMAIRPLVGNPHSRRLVLAWRTGSRIASHASAILCGMQTAYLETRRRQPALCRLVA